MASTGEELLPLDLLYHLVGEDKETDSALFVELRRIVENAPDHPRMAGARMANPLSLWLVSPEAEAMLRTMPVEHQKSVVLGIALLVCSLWEEYGHMEEWDGVRYTVQAELVPTYALVRGWPDVAQKVFDEFDDALLDFVLERVRKRCSNSQMS